MMDYEELGKKLHDELDALLVSIESLRPDDSIVDLELKFTSAAGEDLITVITSGSELLELVDGTWEVEETFTRVETSPQ